MKYFILSIFLAMGCFSFGDEDKKSHSSQARFKLYCMYTPQYRTLYEQYFLPSIKDDFEIILREYPQECPTGIFASAGWEKTMLHKLELLREAIEEHRNNQIFFHSDVDIIFLRPMLETALQCLGDNDFVVQQGWPRNKLCAGFFVMRGNEKTLKLITMAIDLLQKKVSPNDQSAIQKALDSFEQGEIAWTFLPSEQFPNGKRVLKKCSKGEKGGYSAGSEIILDDSIILFHANCTVGLANKYHFLKTVQEEFLRKQSLDIITN